MAEKPFERGFRRGRVEGKREALEILRRSGKLSEDEVKEYLQVLEEDEDTSHTANSIIPTPRTTESPVASPTKRLFKRTFSHVEIPVASSSSKRKDPDSFEHIGSPSKRIRQDCDDDDEEEEEEEAYASNEEAQAEKRWKGKEKELDIDAGPSRLTPEHSTLRRKPLKPSNSRVFVEIPILTSSQKGRTSRDKVRSNWIAGSFKHKGSNLTAFPSTSKRQPGYLTPTIPPSTARSSLAIDENDYDDEYSSDTSIYFESDNHSRPNTSRSNTRVSSSEMISALTPNVHRIAKKFFRHKFEVIGPDLSSKKAVEREVTTNFASHPGHPESMKWGQKLAVEENKIFFNTINLDGEEYEVGDVVMVEPGDDDRKGRQGNYKSKASQSSNGNANRFWFIQICYFFEDTDTHSKKFHGRWLEHGSKTFLQETAHSHSLFLTKDCDDAPASSIFRKCDVKFLQIHELEGEDDKNFQGDTYFCQYTWLDSEDPTFVSLPLQEEVDKDLEFSLDYRRCHSCVLNERQKEQESLRIKGNCISQFGVDYHTHEFVYIRPAESNDELLGIAQIISIPRTSNSAMLKVRMLKHMDTCHTTEESFADELLLEFDGPEVMIPFDRVDGKCFVACFPRQSVDGFAEWIKGKDHFYVVNSKNFKHCAPCMQEHEMHLATYKDYLAQEGLLSMLELFSGAGGLGTGIEQSNFAKTVAAVEYDRNAAETYLMNHSDTAVFCKDVVELLRELENGDDIESLNRKPFPKPGDIDIIVGGPPCQAFSGANHNRKQDDIRSSFIFCYLKLFAQIITLRATLPFTMLSYVERYLPKYFLLENVVGLLRHRLLGILEGRSILGGIQHGVFKLITRILLTLGYQVRVKVLQAANYGAPQSRERVIFWGARQGLKLPEFPIPTHAYAAKEHHLLQHADLKLSRSTRSRDPARPHFFAPFRAVTVNDAIGDLPAFDWINPHELIPATEQDEVRNIPRFQATHGRDLPGFLSGEYAHPPINYFQKFIREGMNEVVEEHVTPMFSPLIVERTINVPMKPGASLQDTPVQLHLEKKKLLPVIYLRLNPNQCFRTALTHCSPAVKNSYLLHYSQKRIITVREFSRRRSQGL
ncbi:DNA (cytosine-5)-methyltransferase 1B [Lentinula edodes]|uniref:Cytosine-specific methyltransferase n=1 Tax=Lentinula edodes TaxID=5353 RepID=A0A1Q3E7F6_LENED|nr:DNA (cytosine-5)-methyltransferase 1B [Lentinula edodes]